MTEEAQLLLPPHPPPPPKKSSKRNIYINITQTIAHWKNNMTCEWKKDKWLVSQEQKTRDHNQWVGHNLCPYYPVGHSAKCKFVCMARLVGQNESYKILALHLIPNACLNQLTRVKSFCQKRVGGKWALTKWKASTLNNFLHSWEIPCCNLSDRVNANRRISATRTLS